MARSLLSFTNTEIPLPIPCNLQPSTPLPCILNPVDSAASINAAILSIFGLTLQYSVRLQDSRVCWPFTSHHSETCRGSGKGDIWTASKEYACPISRVKRVSGKSPQAHGGSTWEASLQQRWVSGLQTSTTLCSALVYQWWSPDGHIQQKLLLSTDAQLNAYKTFFSFHCSGVCAPLMLNAWMSAISSFSALLMARCLSSNLFPSKIALTTVTSKAVPQCPADVSTTSCGSNRVNHACFFHM